MDVQLFLFFLTHTRTTLPLQLALRICLHCTLAELLPELPARCSINKMLGAVPNAKTFRRPRQLSTGGTFEAVNAINLNHNRNDVEKIKMKNNHYQTRNHKSVNFCSSFFYVEFWVFRFFSFCLQICFRFDARVSTKLLVVYTFYKSRRHIFPANFLFSDFCYCCRVSSAWHLLIAAHSSSAFRDVGTRRRRRRRLLSPLPKVAPGDNSFLIVFR